MKAFNLDRHWAEVGSTVNNLANHHMIKGVFQRGELTEHLEERICEVTEAKVALLWKPLKWYKHV